MVMSKVFMGKFKRSLKDKDKFRDGIGSLASVPKKSRDMEQINRLETFLDYAWQQMSRATVDSKSPFRYPVLITAAGEAPYGRTVVLRESDQEYRSLICYTHVRSAKVRHLHQNPYMAWHFYHDRHRIQLRFQGRAFVHHQDALAEAHWERIPPQSWGEYHPAQVPGSIHSGGPPDTSRSPDQDERPDKHAFALIRTEVHFLEALQLHPEGHRRAQFMWRDTGWEGDWLWP